MEGTSSVNHFYGVNEARSYKSLPCNIAQHGARLYLIADIPTRGLEQGSIFV